MSKPDGSEDYNERLLKSAAQVKNSLTRYRQLDGSNEELSTVVDNFLMESVTNKMFGDVISPHFEKGTALYEMVANNPYYQKHSRETAVAGDNIVLDTDYKVSEYNPLIRTRR